MATFQAQVESLTSLSVGTTPTTTELSQFLKDGVIDVTNRWLAIRPQDIENFTRESAEQTSNGFNPGASKIASVIRESGTDGEWYPCTKRPINLQYLVTDTESLHFASKYNPVYMITQNRNVHVYPSPSGAGNDGFKVLYVNYDPEESDGTDLQYDSTGIKWFPDDKVYLVALYASIKTMAAVMNNNVINVVAVPPDIPSLSAQSITITGAAPTYTAPTTAISGEAWATEYPTQGALNTTALTAINDELDKVAAIVVEASEEFDESKNLTAAYNGVINTAITAISTNVGLAKGVIDISAVPPDVPTLSSQSVTITGAAPTYDNSISNTAIALVTTTIAEANNFIDSSEDVELAAAKLSEVQATVGDAKLRMENELHEFNEDNIEYQAKLQKDIQDANLADASEARKLTKYQTEISEYQAEIGEMSARAQGYISIAQGYLAVVQGYAAGAQTFITTGNAYLQEAQSYIAEADGYSREVQARLSSAGPRVSEYQAKMQNALNVFNDANVEYQATLQKNIQDAQLSDANEMRKLQKYQAEITIYQAEVNAEVQEKTAKMQQYQLLYTQLKAEYDGAFATAAPRQQAQPQVRA